MVELNGVRIWAIGFDRGSATPARKLVCGTLARPLAEADPLVHALGEVPGRIAVPGRPHLTVARNGWFELVTGEVVAVFGAVVEPVG